MEVRTPFTFNMLTDDQYSRLSTLLPLALVRSILKAGAYIAGGSVVYTLLSGISKRSVADIDVFIPSKDIFRAVVDILDLYANGSRFFYEKKSYLYNFYCDKLELGIQLVYKRGDTLEDILWAFSEDYVQCGLYFEDDDIYSMRSNICVTSHTDRIVYKMEQPAKDYRVRKIHCKGFAINSETITTLQYRGAPKCKEKVNDYKCSNMRIVEEEYNHRDTTYDDLLAITMEKWYTGKVVAKWEVLADIPELEYISREEYEALRMYIEKDGLRRPNKTTVYKVTGLQRTYTEWLPTLKGGTTDTYIKLVQDMQTLDKNSNKYRAYSYIRDAYNTCDSAECEKLCKYAIDSAMPHSDSISTMFGTLSLNSNKKKITPHTARQQVDRLM